MQLKIIAWKHCFHWAPIFFSFYVRLNHHLIVIFSTGFQITPKPYNYKFHTSTSAHQEWWRLHCYSLVEAGKTLFNAASAFVWTCWVKRTCHSSHHYTKHHIIINNYVHKDGQTNDVWELTHQSNINYRPIFKIES